LDYDSSLFLHLVLDFEIVYSRVVSLRHFCGVRDGKLSFQVFSTQQQNPIPKVTSISQQS